MCLIGGSQPSARLVNASMRKAEGSYFVSFWNKQHPVVIPQAVQGHGLRDVAATLLVQEELQELHHVVRHIPPFAQPWCQLELPHILHRRDTEPVARPAPLRDPLIILFRDGKRARRMRGAAHLHDERVRERHRRPRVRDSRQRRASDVLPLGQVAQHLRVVQRTAACEGFQRAHVAPELLPPG
ncbi:hypothetical protein GY45DRAFT_377051 [Cubamyces sp. BRFM 1775]|nr:hypothetical protein GY45DRAFT_377051 [Cubamyces sp. BRFM 1775]